MIWKKASRFDAYTEVVPECWLLIVADDFGLSGNFDLPAHTLAHEYVSPFSRTYLLQVFKSQVYRLNADMVPPAASEP